MHVRLLSRASALAVLQAGLVEQALVERWPTLDVQRLTRSSSGDRDVRVDLWAAAAAGGFTSDLSQALVDGEADAAVHSWKDLPIAGHPGTLVVATLSRADPRDVLLVRRAAVSARSTSLAVLSSSPRRAWQIQTSAPRLLPWPVTEVRVTPVRGNVPTRLSKLVNGDGDALIVAKAALDRLLASPDTAQAVRAALARCRWMVLPVKEHPTAPAQGAIAIEVAANRTDLIDRFRAISHESTWAAVDRERQILQAFGGGCREAVGATVLERDYGRVISVRAHIEGEDTEIWSLETGSMAPEPVSADRIWPRPEERTGARRRSLDVTPPGDDLGLWVTRAEALPAGWKVSPDRLVWAAGSRTWERLAARGVWVNGCADGLGDAELPAVDALAGHAVAWRRLTHASSGDPAAFATYVVDQDLPDDLLSRTHFFWTSGSAFTAAMAAEPRLRSASHASGPGRTARVIRDTLGPEADFTVWLDYDQWHQHLTS